MQAGSTADLLEIVPVGDVDDALLTWLAAELEASFASLSSTRAPALPPREEWRRSPGGPWCADRLLDSVIERYEHRPAEPARYWILAVTGLDLSAPERPFVFGEATLGGCCAVVSLARLHPHPSPQGEELALLRTRLLKEAVHELGHVAGLGHCANHHCVMSASPGLREVDGKSSRFCARCSRRLPEPLRERA
jgi:predicted Zn-dependent protease